MPGVSNGSGGAGDEMSALESAIADAAAASVRREQLEKIICEGTAKLKADKKARKGQGSGRLSKRVQDDKKALEHKIARAKAGLLPGDPEPKQQAAEVLVRAAAHHHRDHAAGIAGA